MAPTLEQMFPKGKLKFKNDEHMVRVDLSTSAQEYWQMQIFKMITARGFVMRTSHSSGFHGMELIAATYTFGR